MTAKWKLYRLERSTLQNRRWQDKHIVYGMQTSSQMNDAIDALRWISLCLYACSGAHRLDFKPRVCNCNAIQSVSCRNASPPFSILASSQRRLRTWFSAAAHLHLASSSAR